MSPRALTIIAFVVAIAATVVGWSQSMMYKWPPPVRLASWFPFVVLSDARDVGAVFASFIQFPIFALAFSLAIRRWSVVRVLIVLALIYGAFALVAVSRLH